MKCDYDLYGCYTCCYKFKVSDPDKWNLELCPKCGSPTVACIHKALKIMNHKGCEKEVI